MSCCARKSVCDRVASIASIASIVGVLLIAAGSANAAYGDTETAESAATAVSGPAKPAPRARVRAGGSMQHRADALAKALELSARQRTSLMTILEDQRQAVTKIWSDPALLPAERTPATRAVEERTADQIRGILSEEQKKLYNPPKPQATEPPPPDVEGWMQKQAQARQPQ
jgi:hypothetical protein